MVNWFQSIHVSGALQALFLFLILTREKNNSRANKIFSVLMLLIAINMLVVFLTYEKYEDTGSRIGIIFSNCFNLLYGPFLMLYTLALVKASCRFHSTDLLHFIPTALFGLLRALPLLVPALREGRFNAFLNVSFMAGTRITIIFGFAYTVLSLFILKRYRRRLSEYYSGSGRVRLYWLRQLLLAALAIWLVSFLSTFEPAGGAMISSALSWTASLGGIFLLFAIGYFTTVQPEVLAETPASIQGSAPASSKENAYLSSTVQDRYVKNRLDESSERTLLATLLRFMKSDRPYLNPTLTIVQLSEMSGIPAHHISMVINLYLKKNFYSFINGYRVEEAKARLADASLTADKLLSIGLDSGFNSKSSFNAVFKRFMGLTPSGYRNMVRAQVPHVKSGPSL